MAIKVVNARDIRNQVGVNGVPTGATGAGALDFLNLRWVRNDVQNTGSSNNVFSGPKALASAMSSMFDPNPKYQVIVDGYLQDASSWVWTNTQQDYLKSAAAVTGNNSVKLLKAIEGPNEWGWGDGNTSNEQGGGSILPDGTTDQDQSSLLSGGQWNSVIFAGIQQWSSKIASLKSSNSSTFSGVEILSLTALDFSGTFGYYPNNVNIKQYVDYGTFHFYTNTPGSQYGDFSGSASAVGYQGNRMYKGMQGGYDGGSFSLPMVISEGGPWAEKGGNSQTFSQDGYSEMWAMANSILDVFALGGHRFMIYTCANHTDFELFVSNALPSGPGQTGSPKPKAYVVKNMMSLMSLNNNYKDTSNLSDTSSFTPAYNSSSLSVSGPSDTPGSGSPTVGGTSTVVPMPLVCPKSDGSTIIWVWREPALETNTSGTSRPSSSTVPSAVSTTVSFGSSQSWKLWDPSGSGNGQGMSASGSPSQLTSGSGSSATFNLYGMPLAIELAAVAATSAPAAPSASISSTTSTRVTVAWTQSVGSTNAPSSFDVQYQKTASTGTWITQANLTDTSARSYTFYGLDVSSTYYFRIVAKNSIGSTNSNTPNTTTLAQQTTKTPSVTSNIGAKREDSPNATTSVTLALTSVPASGNSVLVTWCGFGANGNSSSISAPSNAVKLSGPNNDSADEVTWAWLIPADGSTNGWTFSGYDTADNGVFNLVELTNVNTYEVSHGAVSTATATSIGWPIPTASFSNNACISLLAVTHAVTSVGSGSTGVTVLRSDASSVNFHQSILTKSTASGNVSVSVTGATASDPDTYLNVYVYGVTAPNKVTGVAKANVTDKSATISWDSQGSSASAYKVEISSDNGSSWTQIGSVVSGSASSLNVSSLSASTTYLFRVSAYNDAGIGTASDNLSVTTTATPSIAVVQHATANDNSGSTQSLTVALTNSVAVGNTLWFYFTGKNGNTSSLAPSGAQNVISDSNADQFQLAWTTTASATTNSFTVSGYSDLATFSVVELQGVSSIDTPTHASSTTYADGTSGHVTLPVTAPSSTPAIGIYGVNMDIAPDSYGTMPSNITLLDKTTGNSGSSPQDIEYHKGAIFQVGSGVSGSQSIPYVLGNSVTQGGNPTYVGYNFIGTAATNPKPGSTSLVFDSSTTDSITMHWSAASGTVTQYKINVSTNSGMT